VEAGKFYKLPIIWAAVLGILLSWLTIPGPVRIPLEFISDSTSPLALLATGAMAEGAMLKADLKNIGVLSAIKLVVAPALVAVTGRNAGKHGRHVQDIPAGGGDAGRRDEHRAGLTVQDAGRICLPRGHHIDRTICPDNCDNINIFVKIIFLSVFWQTIICSSFLLLSRGHNHGRTSTCRYWRHTGSRGY